MIEFHTLGVVDLRSDDGRELHSLLAQPKRIALLAYLSVAAPPRFHRRDSLIGLFWPEADETHARTSLRSSLHVLRRILGERAIQTRGDEEIAVNFDAVHCDAKDFIERVAAGKLESAVELYRGDLLPGFLIDDAPAFDHWLENERNRLRGAAARATASLVSRYRQEGRLSEAIEGARRVLALAPSDEPAVRQLIELLAINGDVASALDEYDRFATQMAREYQTKPSQETERLADRLRHRAPGSLAPPLYSAIDNPTRPSAVPPEHREPSAPARRLTSSRMLWTVGVMVIVAAVAFATLATTTRANREKAVTRRKLTSVGNAMLGSVSRDGEFLTYLTQSGDSQNVVIQDLTEGSRRTIKTFTSAVFSLEWTPDGGHLIVGGLARAVVLPRLGGELKMIGPDLADQAYAYMAPDSAHFAVYTSGSRRILVVDADTQDTVSVPVNGRYTWLDEGGWSPDAQTFAVLTESDDPVTREIRTVNRDGRGETIVTDSSASLGSPQWSRDGRWLYYARGPDEIWSVQVSAVTGARESNPEKVLDDLQLYSRRFGLFHFSLSPDGRGMIYDRGARYSNLWLLQKGNGAAPKSRIALTTGTSLRWSPIVSPDGKSIAYAQETPKGGEVFRIPIGGGSPQQVTSGARIHKESQIAWSPDGREIAFSSVRAGHAQVWIVDVADGAMRGFSQSRMSTSTGGLAWGPGAEIAYQRFDNRNITLLDPISGGERALVHDSMTQATHAPRYSPDGKHLAIFWPRKDREDPEIYSFNTVDLSRELLGQGSYPRGWSSDGRYVFYQWPHSPVIYRLDAKRLSKPEVYLSPSFREAECKPVGLGRPDIFLCVAFEFASDIWQIDNFDQRSQ